MILVDANVLLYAVNHSDPSHGPARAWLEGALNGSEPVGFAWLVVLAFLRISTSARVFASPLDVGAAAGYVEEWFSSSTALVVSPTPRHLAVLAGLLSDTGTAANLVNDAHLAALAVEHGARIASFDRDFARFAGISVTIPSDNR